MPALLVGLLGAVVAANTLANGFVYDDVQNILGNRWLREPGSLREVFTSHVVGFDPAYSTSYYRPLMHVFYMLAYRVGGLTPWVYHLLNLLFHAGACVLAVMVVERACRDLRGAGSERENRLVALIAGAVFAVHPVHAEPVAWLAGITDLSFAFFFLLAFRLYQSAMDGSRLAAALAGLAFLAATLCKEPALTLPLFVLAYEALVARRRASPPAAVALRFVPLAIAAAGYLVLRLNALGALSPAPSHRDLTITELLASGIVLAARYIGALVAPIGLGALHPFDPVRTIADVRFVASLVVLVALAAAVIRARRSGVFVFAVALAIIPLAPALYIPGLGEVVFAERYLYLPVLGFGVLAGIGALRMGQQSVAARRAAGAGVALLCLLYGAASIARHPVWRDNVSLWSAAVATSPGSAAAHENLGFALYEAGRVDECIRELTTALTLDPHRPIARANLGAALMRAGRLEEAVAHLRQAASAPTVAAEALVNLGSVLLQTGRAADAEAEFRAALARNPSLAAAHHGLAASLWALGRRGEALAHFERAARLVPADTRFQQDLAAARAGAGAAPP